MNEKFLRTVVRRNCHCDDHIRMAVHPFKLRGEQKIVDLHHLEALRHNRAMSAALCDLGEELWEKIPGLDHLIFSNGEVTILHNEVFGSDELVADIEAILRRYVERQLEFVRLGGSGR